MKPARYKVMVGAHLRADSDDEAKAREYARRWANAAQTAVQVIDTQAPRDIYGYIFDPDVVAAERVIFVATPKSQRGIPLPRPFNAPQGE